MPDAQSRARDTGVFNAAQALGSFLASTYNGAVFSAFTPAAGGGGGAGQRPTYPREAYALIYGPMAVIVTLSSLLIVWANRILQKQKRAEQMQ